MKSLMRTMILGLVLLVVLAACGSSKVVSSTETTVSDLPVSADEQPELQGMYPAPDLSLVANIGRPQLLNGYANW